MPSTSAAIRIFYYFYSRFHRHSILISSISRLSRQLCPLFSCSSYLGLSRRNNYRIEVVIALGTAVFTIAITRTFTCIIPTFLITSAKITSSHIYLLLPLLFLTSQQGILFIFNIFFLLSFYFYVLLSLSQITSAPSNFNSTRNCL